MELKDRRKSMLTSTNFKAKGLVCTRDNTVIKEKENSIQILSHRVYYPHSLLRRFHILLSE